MSGNPWVVVAARPSSIVGAERLLRRGRVRRARRQAAPAGGGRAHQPGGPRRAAQLGRADAAAGRLAARASPRPRWRSVRSASRRVHHWLTPVFEDWGLPPVAADVAGFVLALLIVTFIHLVVGEMAPKSWAIAHPERSATLLALPMRAFMALFRPVLRALNAAANRLLRWAGVDAVDELAVGHGPDALRHLVEHSANVGALDASYCAQIEGALELRESTLRDLIRARSAPTALPVTANVRQVQDLSRRSGHMRVLLRERGSHVKVVHVRDTLAASDTSQPALPYARDVLILPAGTPVHEALATMRETQSHLVLVTDEVGAPRVVTLADILTRILPSAPDPWVR